MLRFKANLYERKARDAEKQVKKYMSVMKKIILNIFQKFLIGT